MSDGGRTPKEWRFYVEDMIRFCERVQTYTADLDRRTLVADVRTYDATLRNLELIGEAATHIPADVRAAHPEIPWQAIIGARNHLIHGYAGIDNDLIWTMVDDAVPELLRALRQLLEDVREERG